MKRLAALPVSLLLAAALTGAQAQSANGPMYEVKITNITRGASFTPILVASHRAGVKLFDLGQPASDELAFLAEDGAIAPLELALRADGRVVDIASTDGLLGPGQSVTVRVSARRADHISLAAMILPTNDGFIALNGVAAPRFGSETHRLPGYDAGSEPNDELCESIPGPQCAEINEGMMMGEGVSPDLEAVQKL